MKTITASADIYLDFRRINGDYLYNIFKYLHQIQ